MYYFAVVIFILLSIMSTVNVACSNQTHFVYVWDKRYIYLYTLVYVTKLFLSLMAENLYLPLHITGYHLAHIRLKGYSSQKSVDFLLNPFCIERINFELTDGKIEQQYMIEILYDNSTSYMEACDNNDYHRS